jgi:hypothetical protein
LATLDKWPFLENDYERKVRYLSDHFSRMWTRFNFFLVLESGLSAALWLWFRESGGVAFGAIALALVGLASTVVWYIFGAQDRYLVEVYREQAHDAGRVLAEHLGLAGYLPVGSTKAPAIEHKIYQWRYEPLSPTRLAAWFPLLVLVYWLLVIGVGLVMAISAQISTLAMSAAWMGM